MEFTQLSKIVVFQIKIPSPKKCEKKNVIKQKRSLNAYMIIRSLYTFPNMMGMLFVLNKNMPMKLGKLFLRLKCVAFVLALE